MAAKWGLEFKSPKTVSMTSKVTLPGIAWRYSQPGENRDKGGHENV